MFAIVVVAGHEVIRHVQTRQLGMQHGIFIRTTEVHQVAADYHDVGARMAGIQMIDSTSQRAKGVDDAVSQSLTGFKVQIADLRNEKRKVQNKFSENKSITNVG